MSVFVQYCHETSRFRWPIFGISIFLLVTFALNLRPGEANLLQQQQQSLLELLKNLPDLKDDFVSEELEGIDIPGSSRVDNKSSFGVLSEGYARRRFTSRFPLNKSDVSLEYRISRKAYLEEPLNVEEKYLFYPRSGDWCKGVGHVARSLRCALAEARYLNRTLLLDEDFCVRADHDTGHNTRKKFRRYWDLQQIMWHVKVAPLQRFVSAWGDWNSAHEEAKIVAKHVDRLALSDPLLGDPAPIILRSFTVGKEEYSYQVCSQDGNGQVLMEPMASLPLFAAALVEIGAVIREELGDNFKAIHVVRGDKVGDKERWPHLEEDTTAEHIVEIMKTRWAPGERVYVATDERSGGHFARVRDHFRLVMLPDFAHLWAPGSRWWKRYRAETHRPGERVAEDFDETMQAVVDHTVLMAAGERLETFNDFTQDPEAGLKKSRISTKE